MILTTIISTTIEKAEVIDFYKTLLVNQSSNYSTLFSFFLAITGILITASLAYNFFIAKSQVKDEVEKQTEKIENRIENKYKEFYQNKIEVIVKQLEIKTLYNEGITSLLFAMNCIGLVNVGNRLSYLSSGLVKFIEANEYPIVRIVLNEMINSLSLDGIDEAIDKNTFSFESIILSLQNVPKMFDDEKEKIFERLNSIKTK